MGLRQKGDIMNKYAKHKKEYVKLTIRVDADVLNKFKEICKISGLSANNQINIFIKKFNFENKYLFQDNTSIDFWDEENQPK